MKRSKSMIISASRRTDIPAFYPEWFIRRIRAGYCTVPNPFNRQQIARVSLHPEDVDVIVFWTRNPRPLLPHLAELNRRGYRYYFQFTLMDNPRAIDPKSPPLEHALRTFKELADQVGPERVIWRYDPIVFSAMTGAQFHQQTYERIADALHGHTRRSVISLLDIYRKASKRLRQLALQGFEITTPASPPGERFAGLMQSFAQIARTHAMEIVSCAEEIDLRPYGIRAGKCIDDAYIAQVFGTRVADKKDPAQREACGCVVSKDIGAYDTCLFGCQYCYATSSFDLAQRQHAAHDPEAPSLIGWYEPSSSDSDLIQNTFWD